MTGDYVLRIGYSYLGLLAGNGVLLLLLLLNAFSGSLLLHGQMKMLFLAALGQFIPMAIFSIPGWLAIGVPVALLFSSGTIASVSSGTLLLIGVPLGPLALLLILVWLNHGQPGAVSFSGTGPLWACATIISTVSFAVHCALLRQYTRWTAKDQIN